MIQQFKVLVQQSAFCCGALSSQSLWVLVKFFAPWICMYNVICGMRPASPISYHCVDVML